MFPCTLLLSSLSNMVKTKDIFPQKIVYDVKLNKKKYHSAFTIIISFANFFLKNFRKRFSTKCEFIN